MDVEHPASLELSRGEVQEIVRRMEQIPEQIHELDVEHGAFTPDERAQLAASLTREWLEHY